MEPKVFPPPSSSAPSPLAAIFFVLWWWALPRRRTPTCHFSSTLPFLASILGNLPWRIFTRTTSATRGSIRTSTWMARSASASLERGLAPLGTQRGQRCCRSSSRCRAWSLLRSHTSTSLDMSAMPALNRASRAPPCTTSMRDCSRCEQHSTWRNLRREGLSRLSRASSSGLARSWLSNARRPCRSRRPRRAARASARSWPRPCGSPRCSARPSAPARPPRIAQPTSGQTARRSSRQSA
mmetsp:Transcript_95007/g.252315  ORF Transcript_95007/g.252315 Transcript_95007/m.252315 type:complete len:239 (+) Transcript_95007:436-1152(+)